MKRLTPIVLFLTLAGAALLSILSPGEIPIYKLTKKDIGKQTSVSGLVLNAIPIENGTLVFLYNYSTIKVPFFPETSILPGDTLELKGRVSIYNDQLEIIPKSYKIEPPEVFHMTAGDITDLDIQKTARLAGVLTEKKQRSFKLRDQTGDIHVFAETSLKQGSIIEIEGLVQRYKSVLYIRPRSITRLA